MYPPGAECPAYGTKQLFDECVGFFFPHHQDILGVPQRCVYLRPVQRTFQMRQRLNAGHQLNAQSSCIGVQPAQRFNAVPAAQIAEIGLLRYLIGVFGVQHQGVQTHQSHFTQDHFHGLHPGNSVPRTVQHHPIVLKYRLAMQRKTPMVRPLKVRERPEKLYRLTVFHPQGLSVELGGKGSGPAG